MTMAWAGWTIESAMTAVPPSRTAVRRAIVPRRVSDGVGGSQPSALFPPRAGLTRIFRPPVLRPVVPWHAISRTLATHAPVCRLDFASPENFVWIVVQWTHLRRWVERHARAAVAQSWPEPHRQDPRRGRALSFGFPCPR